MWVSTLSAVVLVSALRRASLGVGFIGALSPAAWAETPAAVKISSLSYAGDGCPSNSARALISPDLQAFTLIFDRLSAAADARAPVGRAAARCSVVVALQFVDGWQFSIATVDFRGFAAVDAGAWAKVEARMRFRGGGWQRPALLTVRGPWTNDFLLHEEGGGGREWSPCRAGASRELQVEVAAQAHAQGNAHAYLALDSLDGVPKATAHIYRLRWQRC